MTDSSLPLDAYVIIDNNVVVGLAEYFIRNEVSKNNNIYCIRNAKEN